MMVGQGGVEFSLQSCSLLCMQFICQDHLVILSLISHPQNHNMITFNCEHNPLMNI